ncbi:uncharacterized protein [Arachis hypogaea]|uniref:uncharacterized protein n=2 Tax=Arachis TaxID=3817 RepID=UPI003B224B2F
MATRTKQIALDEIQGTFREQYKRIYDYAHELMRANPGTSVRLQVQRGGQLLTAIGWDPNDQMLPIAYAVVEAETKDSWTWFLSHLATDIGVEKMGRTTFMSDQQKGLLPAYDDVIPGVENRFCVRHLYSNFRKRFPGLQLKQLMWRCAKATHWRDWEKNMAELKAVNQEAYRYLNAIPPRYWSRSRFTYNSKVDTLVNNMSKSFNAAIVDAREKPILTMLEEIRVKLMTRWAENRDLAQKYAGTILPRIRIKLERRSRSAGEWRPYWYAAQKYEVMNGLDKFTVDLGSSECSCRRWQLSGIPCIHAISCIKFKGLELEPYVANCYKREAYLRCYEAVIHPLNGPDLWEITPHPDVMPPPYRRHSHRPVKKRKPAAGDEEQSSRTHMSRKGEKQRCSICGVVGHNKSRCPKPIENEAQNSKKQSKSKQSRGSNNSIPPAAKGGKKSASTQPTPKLTVKRKVALATQPTSSAQSNTVAPPKRPRSRPKGTMKPTPSAQPDPPTSSSQLTTTTLPASQPSFAIASSQPTRHYSVSFTGGPHVSPRKLKLMAKLPLRKWGLL